MGVYETLADVKPIKGTKGRKPKPHSKGGRRASEALAARRAAPSNRAGQSRAEAKREAARKAAAKPNTSNRTSVKTDRAVQPSSRTRPGRQIGRMRAIEAEGPKAAEEALLPDLAMGARNGRSATGNAPAGP